MFNITAVHLKICGGAIYEKKKKRKQQQRQQQLQQPTCIATLEELCILMVRDKEV